MSKKLANRINRDSHRIQIILDKLYDTIKIDSSLKPPFPFIKSSVNELCIKVRTVLKDSSELL